MGDHDSVPLAGHIGSVLTHTCIGGKKRRDLEWETSHHLSGIRVNFDSSCTGYFYAMKSK